MRLSPALRRTLNSSGERSSSSRSSSTGSSRRTERVARPSEKRSTEISEVASIWSAASSKPTSWEKSSRGPISTLTKPSKRFWAARSTGPAPLPFAPAPLGPDATPPAPACASVSSCARRPTSTASRSAFILIRVAWPRACAWISSSREDTDSSEAMLRSWRWLASCRRSLSPRISRSRSITIDESEASSCSALAASSAASRQRPSASSASRSSAQLRASRAASAASTSERR
jgi:hypothetical protein